MPKNATITLLPNTWTLLTDDNVSSLTVQNLSIYAIRLQASNGAVSPPTGPAGPSLLPQMYFPPHVPVSELWKGVPGANRVWAWSAVKAEVWVSHA